ncbi:MAG: magnesium transporter [Candidatus Altiarchaeota archaeon]
MMILARNFMASTQKLVKNFLEYLAESFVVLKESYIAIFITILTSLFAGIFLGKSTELLKSIPGLLVLIPGAIDMRGNIFSTLGSRLGSKFHLGLIEKFDIKNKFIRDEIYASLTLTFLLSIFLGILAKFLSSSLGIESISVYSLILISLIGGVTSGIILLILTFIISFTAYAKGWDPDNVTAPLITALGDLFTIPTLLFAAYLVMIIQSYAQTIVFFLLVFALLNFVLILKKENDFKVLIFHSSIALLASGLLSCFSGVFMEINIEKLIVAPSILLMIPAFLEEGGNISSVLASRLSSKLHLGLIKAEIKIDTTLKKEFFISLLLYLLVFPIIGVLSHILCITTGITSVGILKSLIISTIAGFFLIVVMIAITFYISVVSYERGIDPDNVTIPIITSIADIAGVLSLFIVSMFVLSW